MLEAIAIYVRGPRAKNLPQFENAGLSAGKAGYFDLPLSPNSNTSSDVSAIFNFIHNYEFLLLLTSNASMSYLSLIVTIYSSLVSFPNMRDSYLADASALLQSRLRLQGESKALLF